MLNDMNLKLAQLNWNPNIPGLSNIGQGATAQEKVGNLIIGIIQLILAFSAILAVGAIIWGAIMIILSLGEQGRVEKGKKIIFWAIVGLLLAGLSFLIVRFVGQTLGIKP